MRSNSLKLWALFLLLLSVAGFASGQVVPAAREGSAPIEVGGGASYWKTDWGPDAMIGITGLADFYPSMPGRLIGLGFESEYRLVAFHRTTQPSNYKQQTIGGGPIYTVPFHQKYRFYGKFLLDYGSMDFTFVNAPTYTHDTRTVYAPGGGMQYRIHNNIWARVDYEYQSWPNLFKANKGPTPNGFTVGVGYDLRGFHRQSLR